MPRIIIIFWINQKKDI